MHQSPRQQVTDKLCWLQSAYVILAPGGLNAWMLISVGETEKGCSMTQECEPGLERGATGAGAHGSGSPRLALPYTAFLRPKSPFHETPEVFSMDFSWKSPTVHRSLRAQILPTGWATHFIQPHLYGENRQMAWK